MKKVGNGEQINFWLDLGLSEDLLGERFNKLFGALTDRNISIAEIYRRGWGLMARGSRSV